MKNLLTVNNLSINFSLLDKRKIYAVNNVSLNLEESDSLGIVGESGSGKSQFALSLMGLLSTNASVSGEIIFNGLDMLKLNTKELNKVRGHDISMIFQDPMTSLNPYMKIGRQLIEVLLLNNISVSQAKARAMEMLNLVGISDPTHRMNNYPHQLSGGMRQRVMIAMALLTNPKLLIADEPTTALDVTLQAQILGLIKGLQKRLNIAVIMITHDMGVVAKMCNKIAVFYAGQVVEFGTIEDIFYRPKHPYTIALLESIPKLNHNKSEKLRVIDGNPEPIFAPPSLCGFLDRCKDKFEACCDKKPQITDYHDGGSKVSCLKFDQQERVFDE